MKRIISSFGLKRVENKTKFFIKIGNYELTYNLGEPVLFPFKDSFLDYFKNNNIKNKTQKLKQELDDISCEYIDNFINLTQYWDNSLKRGIWTKYDKILIKKAETIRDDIVSEFGDIVNFNPFIFSNQYGLIDLPKDIYNKIDGSLIIDVGGYNGDTAFMFHKNFPNSSILVYEPLEINIFTINKLISHKNCQNKIIPINKGLGNKNELRKIRFNAVQEAQVVTLDSELADNNSRVGLIKMDVEGFETSVFEGALETIKKHKPVLDIAIYHTAEDFFEMKHKIENLNMGYKFMIRRSEAVLPQADLVLIAY